MCVCSAVLLSPSALAQVEKITPVIGELLMYFLKRFRVNVSDLVLGFCFRI